MNELPGIFRQTQPSGFNRQGPLYTLRLNRGPNAFQSNTLEKQEPNRTRLQLHRYSIEPHHRKSLKKVCHATISYDYLNDPEFYGTKGQFDQVESYNVLIQERRKAIEILGLKVASCRGFREQYSAELRTLANNLTNGLSQVQNDLELQFTALKNSLSALRRQTGQEIKSMKSEVREFTRDLLQFCEQFKGVEGQAERCRSNLEKPIE